MTVPPELARVITSAGFTTFAAAMFGIWLGHYLSQRNAEKTLRLQRILELRHRSYVRLTGLKLPWAQAIQTHLEAKLLSDYYETRRDLFSHHPGDIAEAKVQYDRALSLIPAITDLQRATFEALADAQVSYKPTPELTTALEDVYNFQGVEIAPPDRAVIRTQADLDAWKARAHKELVAQCDAGFAGRVAKVLPHMLAQLRST